MRSALIFVPAAAAILIAAIAVPVVVPSPSTASVPPQCNCTLANPNGFPLAIGGQGTLSETISCTPNSPTGYCTASGNLTWTPSVNCCSGSGSDWSNSLAGSSDSCNTTPVAFSNCTGATANPHSCQVQCLAAPGTGIWFIGTIVDCNSNQLGQAAKTYACWTP